MILCLGATPAVQKTLTFDRLLLDEVNRTADVHTYASGKAINAARVLHTLGRAVLATGFVGGDGGALIRRDLDAAGIAHDFVEVQPGTRACTTVVDTAAHTATELVEESHAVDPAAYEQLLHKLAQMLSDSAIQAEGLLLSGSLPPGAPPDFYARCVALGRSADALVLLDAQGPPLLRALPQGPVIVKPNRRELEQTVGFAIDSDSALKRAIGELLIAGPQWAVITSGNADAVVSDGRDFWRITTPPVAVVSTIGSGDAFAAGLIAGILSGQSIPQSARLAAACGSANALTPLAGHLHPPDVGRLLDQVHVQPF